MLHKPLDDKHIIIEENRYLQKLPNSVWFRYFSYRYLKDFDLLICLEPFTPKFTAIKKAVVVYDLVVFVAPKTMQKKTFINYKLFFEKSLREADYIISVSNGTKTKLYEVLGIHTDFVVRPASNFTPSKDPPIYNFDYILTVSTLEPRKNITSVIKAYISLKSSGKLKDTKLVLVGKVGWKNKELLSLMDKYRDDIIYTGYIDKNTLINLYTYAKIFVFPSLYEGFGIPVLEARKCGCCVITTDIPELKEACGEGCIYVSPTVESIQNAIYRYISGEISCKYKDNQDISWEKEISKLKPLLSQQE